jgi:hypothetical protein
MVCVVNTGILIEKPGETAYLGSSSSLLGLAAHLQQDPRPCDISHIPTVKRTSNFPYRWEGKACFLVQGEQPIVNGEDPFCSKCGPRTSIKRILERMAARILYDLMYGITLRNSVSCVCVPCRRVQLKDKPHEAIALI